MSTPTTPPTATTTWNIDPTHSGADFKVKHLMISNVKGHFAKVSGALTLDESKLTNSHVEATIDAASIETRDPQRDAHLKSADFLDAEKFPTLTFKSTRASVVGGGEHAVEGDLTLHGAARNVIFTVEGQTRRAKAPWGNPRMGASASTNISRKDFGLAWNTALKTGGF